MATREELMESMKETARNHDGELYFTRKIEINGVGGEVWCLEYQPSGETYDVVEYAITTNDGKVIESGLSDDEMYDWMQKYNVAKSFNATAHKVYWYAIADAIRQIEAVNTNLGVDLKESFSISSKGDVLPVPRVIRELGHFKAGVWNRVFGDFMPKPLNYCFACDYSNDGYSGEEQDCYMCPLAGMEYCEEDSLYFALRDAIKEQKLKAAYNLALKLTKVAVLAGANQR